MRLKENSQNLLQWSLQFLNFSHSSLFFYYNLIFLNDPLNYPSSLFKKSDLFLGIKLACAQFYELILYWGEYFLLGTIRGMVERTKKKTNIFYCFFFSTQSVIIHKPVQLANYNYLMSFTLLTKYIKPEHT